MEAIHLLLLLLFVTFCLASAAIQVVGGVSRLAGWLTSWGGFAVRISARLVAQVAHARPAHPQF